MSSSEHDEPDVMSGRGVDMTTGAGYNESEPGRSSPSSAVCYAGSHDDAEKEQDTLVDVEVDPAVQQKRTPEPSALSVHLDDESDSTPRSEVPSAVDSGTAWEQNSSGQPGQSMSSDTGYFAPQPLRYYANRLPSATPSTEPSPTPSLNASTTSVNRVHVETTTNAAADAELQERPSVLRDLSSTSTATTATMRVPSTEPAQRFTTPPKPHKDVPTYPNQAYAALQSQHYPPPYSPQILRTRSSHATHFSVSPSSKIAAFSLANDLDRSVLDTGSRTVGNSPASSPGLFSPTTPPSQHPPDEQGFYSSPYLHYTHRQAPKETHVADVDVDPISGRKIINSYEVIDELGRGVHGKVKLGRNLDTGVYVAIKIVDRYSKRRRLGKNTNHEDKIKKEIAILKKARHPNIVSLLEVIDDPSRKKVYIVLEHVELGEVKWRMEAAKEIAEVEWRRFQRESQGIFDNDAATHEDDSIITTAHRRLEKRERQRLKELHDRRMKLEPQFQTWSFEHGGDSDEETSDNDMRSRMSEDGSVELPSVHDNVNEGGIEQHGQGNTLHTASRSQTPIATSQHVTQHVDVTGLEGTMYGAYEPEIPRGRTPSLAGSLSSHFTDLDDLSDIPEHFRYVPLMTLEGTRDAFRDTVLGLEYLHYQGVIHRDIKPANLLLTKEHKVKISDFGVSFLGKQSPDESDDMSESETHDADEAIELAKTVGTPAFYAPELCRTDLDTETPPVTGKIDVWALGVTLYCLVFGRVPFHDHNTFVLMRLITDTEVYIPRCRLKAVAEKSSSRPSSRGPKYQSISSNRRAPHDLEYEPVNDDLYDLLKRLLLKDPRKRITLKEIKHHPWLLQGIENKVAWVEETDPTRQTQGRKIEVSKDEVAQAVMPIKFMDRVQSVFKKVTGAVVGLGNRGASRRRAQSSVTNPDPGQLSTASSSSTISQDGRRPSLAINESIYAALRSSREPEHPLSHSVTVSPEAKNHSHYFDGSRSRPESPMDQSETSEHPGPLTAPSRPHLSDRAQSTMSTTASIRTIRQSDILNTARAASPPALPALPGTPTALDSPGGSNLGGIFGGLPRRVITSVRSRDRNSAQRTNHNRTQSIDRLVDADDDAHGGPTLALSNTLAAGHVDPPSILKDHSPVYPPMTQIDRLFPDPIERTSSRQSSISSTSSRLNHVYTIEERTASQSPGSYPFPSLQRNNSDDRFNRAKDELMRRRILEDNQRRDRPLSGTYSRPVSALSEIACPPSPDDEVYFERQRLDDLFNRQHPGQGSSIENSPVGYHGSVNTLQSAGLTSSSSEDHFTSMSQSTSNPSIPSVISATSSVALDDAFTVDFATKRGAQSIESSLDPSVAIVEDYAGYDGDHAVESGDDQADSDDSDEEDFIIMTKKSGSKRSESIANGVLARSTERALSSRRRSTRSGSNGTVKKIRPLEETDDDQHQQQSPETTSKTL